MDFDEAMSSDYVYVVAEIGINHNGDLGIARELIDLAAASGCDAVKFQKRTIEVVYSPESLATPRESPWGKTTRAQKEGLEFGEVEYKEIDAHCRAVGIPWFASAWDAGSQDFIGQFDTPFNKVASAMTTNREFLERVAAERKMTFVSTGMCTSEDIEDAVEIFRSHGCPMMLMHSTSLYPCPEENLNLRMITRLQEAYGRPVGYSGHESTVAPSVIAAVLGAKVIERHITLDRAMYGSDQSASLAPRGLRELVDQLRRLSVILGDGVKRMERGEDDIARKLRYWQAPK